MDFQTESNGVVQTAEERHVNLEKLNGVKSDNVELERAEPGGVESNGVGVSAEEGHVNSEKQSSVNSCVGSERTDLDGTQGRTNPHPLKYDPMIGTSV